MAKVDISEIILKGYAELSTAGYIFALRGTLILTKNMLYWKPLTIGSKKEIPFSEIAEIRFTKPLGLHVYLKNKQIVRFMLTGGIGKSRAVWEQTIADTMRAAGIPLETDGINDVISVTGQTASVTAAGGNESEKLPPGRANQRNCANCGAELPEGSAFCAKCGTPVPEDAPTETRQCENCGAELAGGSAFCANCGTPVPKEEPPKPKMRFCGNCGTELVEGARFCANCGTPVPK